jgi:hypothetical protein
MHGSRDGQADPGAAERGQLVDRSRAKHGRAVLEPLSAATSSTGGRAWPCCQRDDGSRANEYDEDQAAEHGRQLVDRGRAEHGRPVLVLPNATGAPGISSTTAGPPDGLAVRND